MHMARVVAGLGILAIPLAMVACKTPQASSEAAITLQLRDGGAITGRVLRERGEAVLMDVGYTVLEVPVPEIVARSNRAARTAPAVEAQPPSASGPARERPVKELAHDLCESVGLVTTPAGLGSAFAIDAAGHFVTNFHVVQGEQDICITLLRQGDTALDRIKVDKVKVIAVNPYVDLALLKLTPPEGAAVKALPIASTDSVQEGQNVFAIGNPLGLERTLSEGIISNTRRNFEGQLYVQTTAPINPGNSGGPLFNLRGEVVGVTNMKAGFLTEGLSFAIPVDTLRFFLKNRDIFAYDKDQTTSGYHYLPPPRKAQAKATTEGGQP